MIAHWDTGQPGPILSSMSAVALSSSLPDLSGAVSAPAAPPPVEHPVLDTSGTPTRPPSLSEFAQRQKDAIPSSWDGTLELVPQIRAAVIDLRLAVFQSPVALPRVLLRAIRFEHRGGEEERREYRQFGIGLAIGEAAHRVQEAFFSIRNKRHNMSALEEAYSFAAMRLYEVAEHCPRLIRQCDIERTIVDLFTVQKLIRIEADARGIDLSTCYARYWSNRLRASYAMFRRACEQVQMSSNTVWTLANEFADQNVGLIVATVRRYKHLESIDQLTDWGREGIIRGIVRFRPEMGYQPSTYLTRAIRSAVWGNIESCGTAGRVNGASRIYRFSELAREGEKRSLAFETGIAAGVEQPALASTRGEVAAAVRASLAALPLEEQEVLNLLFGMGEGQTMHGLNQIAEGLGVSKGVVRNRAERAARRLGGVLSENGPQLIRALDLDPERISFQRPSLREVLSTQQVMPPSEPSLPEPSQNGALARRVRHWGTVRSIFTHPVREVGSQYRDFLKAETGGESKALALQGSRFLRFAGQVAYAEEDGQTEKHFVSMLRGNLDTLVENFFTDLLRRRTLKGNYAVSHLQHAMRTYGAAIRRVYAMLDARYPIPDLSDERIAQARVRGMCLPIQRQFTASAQRARIEDLYEFFLELGAQHNLPIDMDRESYALEQARTQNSASGTRAYLYDRPTVTEIFLEDPIGHINAHLEALFHARGVAAMSVNRTERAFRNFMENLHKAGITPHSSAGIVNPTMDSSTLPVVRDYMVEETGIKVSARKSYLGGINRFIQVVKEVAEISSSAAEEEAAWAKLQERPFTVNADNGFRTATETILLASSWAREIYAAHLALHSNRPLQELTYINRFYRWAHQSGFPVSPNTITLGVEREPTVVELRFTLRGMRLTEVPAELSTHIAHTFERVFTLANQSPPPVTEPTLIEKGQSVLLWAVVNEAIAKVGKLTSPTFDDAARHLGAFCGGSTCPARMNAQAAREALTLLLELAQAMRQVAKSSRDAAAGDRGQDQAIEDAPTSTVSFPDSWHFQHAG